MLPAAVCIDCKRRFDPRTMTHGRCRSCHEKHANEIPADYWERGEQSARVQAEAEAHWSLIDAWLDRLCEWEAYLRGWLAERGRDGEGAAPAWRWRDLPRWRRERPRPYVYVGDEGQTHTTR